MNKKTKILIMISILAVILLSVILFVIFIPKEYTVKFDSIGGTLVEEQIIKKGGKVVKPESPLKEDYNFLGWYLNNDEYDFSTEVTKNFTLVAKWEKILKKYKVTFATDGGSEVEEQIVEEGNKLLEPTIPTKEGYVFVEWHLDDKSFDFDIEINSDIKLVAKWKELEKYTITFNSNGGSSVRSQVIYEGDKVTKPSTPTKKYYKFVEWQLNGKTYDFDSSVTKNIKLTAKWSLNLPTTLEKPKVEVIGDPFARNSWQKNTLECDYYVKLANHKNYIYEDLNGNNNYFVSAYHILNSNGERKRIIDNVEESTEITINCDEKYDFYIEVVREDSNGNVVASSRSDLISIDAKKDMTPVLEFGAFACMWGSGGTKYCEMSYDKNLYTYRLDVWDSVLDMFFGGIIEIYEVVNGNYVFVDEAEHEGGLFVELEPNTKKTYVARAYVEDSNGRRAYGNFSNELIIDTSKENTESRYINTH